MSAPWSTAPFGRIPTHLFAEPIQRRTNSTREQEMVGYQFEKNRDDDLNIRPKCSLCAR